MPEHGELLSMIKKWLLPQSSTRKLILEVFVSSINKEKPVQNLVFLIYCAQLWQISEKESRMVSL